MTEWLHKTNGITRCWWPGEDPLYLQYHDREWGWPVDNDSVLFEQICLEGFQSGLTWITILRKRENFRTAFKGFDIEAVARFSSSDINRLLSNKNIIRHRDKIQSTISNAQLAIKIAEQHGSLCSYFWSYEPKKAESGYHGELPTPTATPTSRELSKDLKGWGWRWVGPKSMYALMQSMGLVNDHLQGCESHAVVEDARNRFIRPK